MNFYRYPLLLLILGYLLSCDSKKGEHNYQSGNNEFTHDLIASGEFKLPLDESTSNVTLYLETYKDVTTGKELLVYLNRNKPAILYYDLESRSLFKEIKLEKEGPSGVGHPTGLLTHSWDSIFVISAYTYQVSLVDSTGKLLKSYRTLEGADYNDKSGLIQVYSTSPAIFKNTKLYFVSIPDRNPFLPSFYEASTNSSLDIKTGKLQYFNEFPQEMKNNSWGPTGMTHYQTYNDEHHLFISSFPVSDSLLIWNPHTNRIQRKFAGSMFKEAPSQPLGNSRSEQERTEYLLKGVFYLGVTYDPYRNVYYRFVWLPTDVKNEKGEPNDENDKPLSVIVLDKNFKIIAEKELEQRRFLNYMYYVGKNGLYISNSNPKNPQMEEDFAVFTCFKLAEK